MRGQIHSNTIGFFCYLCICLQPSRGKASIVGSLENGTGVKPSMDCLVEFNEILCSDNRMGGGMMLHLRRWLILNCALRISNWRNL